MISLATHFRNPGRPTAAALVGLAVVLHNLEEAIFYPVMRPQAVDLVRRAWPGLEPPAPIIFQTALVLLTVAAGVLLAWAARTGRDRAGWLVLRAVALVLLVNLFVPHLPAAAAFGGYSPGVATALAVNLPLSLWILTRRGGQAGQAGAPA